MSSDFELPLQADVVPAIQQQNDWQREQAQRVLERIQENRVEFEPLARVTDPETSHLAAANARERAKAQRAQILEALKTRSMTNDQLDEHFGWREGTASRRTVELLRSGDLFRPGNKRKTRTGEMALVNSLTPF